MIEMNVITIVFSTIFYCWLVLFHILILDVEGSTCANTPVDNMHKLVNAYVIKEDGFGALDNDN